MLVPTLKQSDSSKAKSHDLLLRAGMIRLSSAGIYSFLPMGLRVLDKLKAMIDTEMQACGGQKVYIFYLTIIFGSFQPTMATNRTDIYAVSTLR